MECLWPSVGFVDGTLSLFAIEFIRLDDDFPGFHIRFRDIARWYSTCYVEGRGLSQSKALVRREFLPCVIR
jgi:hypothetical protein